MAAAVAAATPLGSRVDDAPRDGCWVDAALPGDPVILARGGVPGFLQLPLEEACAGQFCRVLLHDGLEIPDASLEEVRPSLPAVDAAGRARRRPSVSVQLVTRERPALLRHALGLLAAQDLPRSDLEVVVVDDAPRCALEFGAARGLDAGFVQQCLRYIHVPRREPITIGAKRNLAATASCGEVLMQWDDDDFYGPTRARLQAEPILAGSADLTLLPLQWSFCAGDGAGPDGFYTSAGAGGHVGTLAYRRPLWCAEDALRQYPACSLMEDLFLHRNLTGLFGARELTLAAGAVDFVLVRHGGCAAAVPRGGAPAPRGPAFLSKASAELLGSVRDLPARAAPAPGLAAQVRQELGFAPLYGAPSGGVRMPRGYLLSLARIIPLLPGDRERAEAREELAERLLEMGVARMDGPTMTMCAWCCSTLRLPAEHGLWSAVAAAIAGAAETLSATDVGMLCFVAGRVGLGASEVLVGALFRRVRELDGELRPQDVVNIVSAVARLSRVEDDILPRMLERFPPAAFSSEEWFRLAWATHRLRWPLAGERLLPRFLRAPRELAERAHGRLAALPGGGRGARLLGDERVPLVLCRGFATREECGELRRIAERTGWAGTEGAARTAVLDRRGSADEPLVVSLRRRAAALLGLPVGHCEPIRVVRYVDDEAAEGHVDYVRESDVMRAMERDEPRLDPLLLGGQRLATVLLHLSSLEDFEGGQTHFEHLGVRVRAEMGAALVWPSVGPDGSPEPLTQRASLPLQAEEHLVAKLWIRSEDVEASSPGAHRPPWHGATPPIGEA